MAKRVYKVGLVSMNSVFRSSKNPYIVRNCIRKAKKLDLDLLIAPEWALMSPYNERFKLAPKDAKDLLPHDVKDKVIEKQTRFPFSPKEARNLLDILKKESRGSDMLVMPGTMMIYTEKRTLYNTMPIISNGKIIYSVLKNKDGGSRVYSLKDYSIDSKPALEVKPNIKDLNNYEKRSIFEKDGIVFGVEICADSGLLSKFSDKKSIDIQVLSSAGKRNTNISALKDNGYAIFCDGDPYRRKTSKKSSLDGELYSTRPISIISNASGKYIKPDEMDKNLYVYTIELDS